METKIQIPYRVTLYKENDLIDFIEGVPPHFKISEEYYELLMQLHMAKRRLKPLLIVGLLCGFIFGVIVAASFV